LVSLDKRKALSGGEKGFPKTTGFYELLVMNIF
jgi:hypothetical protein